MANPEKVVLKIPSVKGTCNTGHRAGQEFDLSNESTLGFSKDRMALCPSAFYAAYPYWRVLRLKGEFPWEENKDLAHAACPDPFNPVIMESRRVNT